MNQTLIVRPGDDPVETKIKLLLKDKMFSFRFVAAWLEKYGYRLTRVDGFVPADTGECMPAQSPADAADPEPEYVPLIE